MAERTITTEGGASQPLPTDVIEHDTTKTSVYTHGKLVYDGATGEGVRPGSELGPSGASLNEMLKWSIEHSDPAELKRRAAEGTTREPSRIDKEIMDMILGQPTVAKMRECLGKLEAEALAGLGGLDAACGALEELEYYTEDLDNANDLAKIGGLAALRRCCAVGLLGADDPDAGPSGAAAAEAVERNPETAAELREAACGVLAAMVQNNPTVAQAARRVGIAQLLLALLSGGGTGEEAARVGGLPVVRKALLALSALLRTADPPAESTDITDGAARTLASAEAAAAAADAAKADGGGGEAAGGGSALDVLALALPTLRPFAQHTDLKLRRRALFLLAALASESTAARTTLLAAKDTDEALLRAVLAALADDDEDVRTQSSRLLLALGADEGDGAEATTAFVQRLAAAGGGAACQAALDRHATADASSVDPEEGERLRRLAGRLAHAA